MRKRHLLTPGATVAAAALLMLVLTTIGQPGNAGPVEAAGQLRIAGVGSNDGDQAANDLPLDIPGATVTRINEAAFNALSPQELRGQYEVIIITWDSSSSLNADWDTRILPYLKLGGGVIFEDPNNIRDLAAIIDGFEDNTGGDISVIQQVPGLTDEVLDNEFSNSHIGLRSWAPWLQPFLEGEDTIVGLVGKPDDGRRSPLRRTSQSQGTGCLVVTGPDQDFHADRSGDREEQNQYRLLLNEVRYVASCAGSSTSKNPRHLFEESDPESDQQRTRVLFGGR